MATKTKMIDSRCHGCDTPMLFEAKPVTIVNMTGKAETFYGKNDAPWICGTCRQDPSKLKAARLACGLPAEPSMPAGYDEDEKEVA